MEDEKRIEAQPDLYANHQKIAAVLELWASDTRARLDRPDYALALEEVAAQLRNGHYLEGGRLLDQEG